MTGTSKHLSHIGILSSPQSVRSLISHANGIPRKEVEPTIARLMRITEAAPSDDEAEFQSQRLRGYVVIGALITRLVFGIAGLPMDADHII